MARTLSMLLLIVLLAAGCAMNGSFPIMAEHFSITTVEKNDPEKSYGEVTFDKISGGGARRRVIGWKDRAT